MKWTEKSTREYLDQRGIKYETYTALGRGDTYEERARNCEEILSIPYEPYHSMLRYGSIGDICETCRYPEFSEQKTLIGQRGQSWIIRDEPRPGYSHAFYLADPSGAEGPDKQFGGTLESFIAYLDAWASMARTPGPFAPMEV